MALDPSPSQPSREFAGCLAAARAGCRISLGDLLGNLRPYLRSIAEQCRGGPTGSDSWQDLVQETYLSAVHGFVRFRGGSDAELRAWLRRILLRLIAKDAMERARRPIPLPVPEQESNAQTPAWLAAEQEQGERFEWAKTQLSPEHREVLVQRSRNDLDWEAVGKHLGKSGDAARKLHMRAIQELSRLLKPS